MTGFTKLFSSITESSVWCEDNDVLRVWVAMLAKAGADGVVEGSVPGFASLCRMSVSEFEKAVKILVSPDKYSRSKEHDGRRIEAIDGGWVVLNHAKYRQRSLVDREGSRAPYMREYRARKREEAFKESGGDADE